MGAVSRLENGWISGSWGFDSLSFRLEAWPSWKGSALLARRRHRRSQVRVLLPPLHRCDVVQMGGPPAVNRWMLVRAQPSQLSCPGRPADRGRRSLTPATRVRIPLGAPCTRDVESAGADPTSRKPLKSAASRPRAAPTPESQLFMLFHALGRVWGCGPAVSRVRRVRSPSRAPSRRRSVDEHHAPTVAHGGSNPPGETASQG